MRKFVDYDLDFNLKNEITKIKNVILKNLSNIEIYLFGSIAKGKYSKSSDIDILVLINEDKSLKELREIRHFLEDNIDILNLSRDVDIKVYEKDRYFNLSTNPSFEKEILKDLIDIKEW